MWEELLECIEDHARLASAEGRLEFAARLLAAAAKSREALGLARSPRRQQHWQDHLDMLRRELPRVEFEAAWAEGREWQADQAAQSAIANRAEAVAA